MQNVLEKRDSAHTAVLFQVLQRRHLPALDGLRGVFVMLVVLYHAGLPLPGDLGVAGFFVLSGFLITWLLLKERRRTGGISLSAFYTRRSLRIFPAYFAFIGLSMVGDAALGLFDVNWGRTEILSALTYTVNYDNAITGHTHPTAHAWSLAIEEQFYLLWPALFLFLAGRNRLTTGLAALVVSVLAWRVILFAGFDVADHYVYNAFDTRFDSLAVGCLMAVLCTTDSFVARAERLGAKWWYPLPFLAALWISRVTLGDGWRYTFGFTADALILAVLILQMLQLSSTAAWRWLNHPFAVWTGALSYSIYLWHMWGISPVDNLLKGFGGFPLQVAFGVAGAYAFALGSYYGIERPFLRLKRRFSTEADTKGPTVAVQPGVPQQESAGASTPLVSVARG